jgi:regulator of sigma E protease
VVAPDELHRSFNRQSVWRRMAIVVAGPLANLFLAVLIYWGLFSHGMEELRPILGAPVASTPAALAGFENGERVLKIGGEFVQTWQDMRWVLLRQAVNRDSIEFEVINSRQETSVRHLDVSSARANGWEGDALDKLGVRFFQANSPPVVGEISAGSAAAVTELRLGDVITAIDRQSIKSGSDVVRIVRESAGRTLNFVIKRRDQQLDIPITPSADEKDGHKFGRIGVLLREGGAERSELMIVVRYGPLSSLGKAISEAWDQSAFSVVMFGKMISGEVSWRNISGPVTIADYAGQSAKLGIDYYLKFMALVSISLAVLNLLPIPILDGGHLLYYLVEVVKRSPLSERSMEIGQQIGLALLLMLMACAFYNDINRLISG